MRRNAAAVGVGLVMVAGGLVFGPLTAIEWACVLFGAGVTAYAIAKDW